MVSTRVCPGERGRGPSRERTRRRRCYGRVSPEDSAEPSRGDGLSSPWSLAKVSRTPCSVSALELRLRCIVPSFHQGLERAQVRQRHWEEMFPCLSHFCCVISCWRPNSLCPPRHIP